MGEVLDHEPTVVELVGLVRMWRKDETKPVACPSCGAPLEIHDRSARPYREWYALTCGGCGFDRTVSIPLAAAVPGAS